MSSYEFFQLTLKVRLLQKRPELGEASLYEQQLDDEISRVIKILTSSERYLDQDYRMQNWKDIIE